MATFPELVGDEWQHDPSSDLTEHAKAASVAVVQQQKQSAEGLWHLVTTSENVYVKLLASRELMTGGWAAFVPVAALQQDRVLALIQTEPCQAVYQPYMDFLAFNFDVGDLRQRGLETLRHVSITSPSVIRRYLALKSLVRARWFMSDHFRTSSPGTVPWIEALVRDRVLTDESNYLRASIANDILDMDSLDAPDTTAFCVQWFLHTGIFPPSRRYDHHWWPKQEINRSYFASERRPLLAVSHSPESPRLAPRSGFITSPWLLAHPIRSVTHRYGIDTSKVYARRHMLGIDRGGPDLELHRVTRVFPIGRLYGKVVFFDEVSEAVVWDGIWRPWAAAKRAEALVADAKRKQRQCALPQD